jgi:hypothetical protein
MSRQPARYRLVGSYLLIGLAGGASKRYLRSVESFDSIDRKRAARTHYLPYLGIAAAFSLLLGSRILALPQLLYRRRIRRAVIGIMFFRQKVTFDESNQLLAMTLSIGRTQAGRGSLMESEPSSDCCSNDLLRLCFWTVESSLQQSCNGDDVLCQG